MRYKAVIVALTAQPLSNSLAGEKAALPTPTGGLAPVVLTPINDDCTTRRFISCL